MIALLQSSRSTAQLTGEIAFLDSPMRETVLVVYHALFSASAGYSQGIRNIHDAALAAGRSQVVSCPAVELL